MKPVTLALAIFATAAVAQSSPPYYDVQSDAFRLILKSDNDTLAGYALGACHQGAAIEGLCLTGETLEDPAATYTTFYHNVSSAENKPVNAIDTTGVLNWILHASGGLEIPSTMAFHMDPGSNVVDMIFSPGYDPYTPLWFDDGGSMYIPVYQDNTVSPPSYYEPTLKLKNWYICLTRYSYTYVSLVWKIGVTGESQNPSCVKVEVERVWI